MARPPRRGTASSDAASAHFPSDGCLNMNAPAMYCGKWSVWMARKFTILLALSALLASAGPLSAQKTTDPRVADLAQNGKVRVGLFLPQYTKDAATGELKGVWAESARALAA